MWDTIGAIHKALGIESTWKFVLVVACGVGLVGTLVGGAVAWVVDMGYKNSAEYKADHAPKPQTVAVTTTNQASQSVTVQQDTTSQGVQSTTSTQPTTKKKRAAQPVVKPAAPPPSVVIPPGTTINATTNAPDSVAVGVNTGTINLQPKSNVPIVTWACNGIHTSVLGGDFKTIVGDETTAFRDMVDLNHAAFEEKEVNVKLANTTILLSCAVNGCKLLPIGLLLTFVVVKAMA